MEIPVPSRASLLFTCDLLKETALKLSQNDLLHKEYLKAYEELIRFDAFLGLTGFASDEPERN